MKTLLALVALLLALAPASQAQAVLRKGDVFDLRLSGMPLDVSNEFALQYTVSDEGRIKIPYIGEMDAAGITNTELARRIEKKLVADKLFTHPTAVVILQQQSRFITIGGEVRAPGIVQWSPGLNLSLAIKRVGGVGEFGKLTKIKVTRDGRSIMFNLKKADKDKRQNPELLPGDEIEVL